MAHQNTVGFEQVNGRSVISTGALVYCNTKYHAPYLAVIDPRGDMAWQDKEYVGYGKHRMIYYVVEDLKAGDLIQAAGGSGGNKYPFKGRVTEVSDDGMTVEEIGDKEWSNLLAERKNGGPAKTLELLVQERDALQEKLDEINDQIARLQAQEEVE